MRKGSETDSPLRRYSGNMLKELESDSFIRPRPTHF